MVLVEVAAAGDEPGDEPKDDPVLEQPDSADDDGCEKVKRPGGGEHTCASTNRGCEEPACPSMSSGCDEPACPSMSRGCDDPVEDPCVATYRDCEDPVVDDQEPDTPVDEPAGEPDQT